MEEGAPKTVVVSGSIQNLMVLEGKNLVEKKYRQNRLDIIERSYDQRERERLQRWLADFHNPAEESFPKDDFLIELAASKALLCLESSAEKDAKQKQTCIIALKKAKADQKKKDFASSEYYHHPETRMLIFFKEAPSMSISDQRSILEESQTDFESIPSESASAFSEILRLESERDAIMLRADKVAWDIPDGNPFKQPANVHERMWLLVSEYSDIWRLYCAFFLDLIRVARNNHRQVAACKNCATIFFPFFPDDYHMHQRSASFKKRISPRSPVNLDVLSERALVDLAKEANAYKKEGGDEYIKLIRVVQGLRGHRASVKYERFEFCENSNVKPHGGTSEKRFHSRNLAVGMLELVVQLHLKVPIGSKLLRYKQHGAGFAAYFQRYRNLVPDFKEEVLFRCFLIEFGRHVRRSADFDNGFKLNSNWWSGRCISPDSAFVSSGLPGTLVKLDKVGLVQLANSLADGTLRVLDDFCRDNENSKFLSCPAVEEDVELCAYLDQMPTWVDNDPVEKRLVPSLRPLCLADLPEDRCIKKNKKISETMLSKRAPDVDPKKLKRLEQQRQWLAAKRSKKGKLMSSRRKLRCLVSRTLLIFVGEVFRDEILTSSYEL